MVFELAPLLYGFARAVALVSLTLYLSWLVAGSTFAARKAVEIAAAMEERYDRLDEVWRRTHPLGPVSPADEEPRMAPVLIAGPAAASVPGGGAR
jgi:hypothetical protein